MKQRILSYFFKNNYENNTLNEFYLSVNNFISLKMYKLQLLDDEHIFNKNNPNLNLPILYFNHKICFN